MDTKDLIKILNNKKKRKYKHKKGGSNSKDRNYCLNNRHNKFRPDTLTFGRVKRASLNKTVWRFNSFDKFDEEG